jgi:UDP-N-acetylglucosamine diphosphorylase / glucose-1-phosphate thymidylyltransferase / UDP-N-acetylgalactosamine diphosphorylase / glucosamine-1-phosphate N-acetyltransferase / galactosamine-1-phosphate N-acetyltransferase
MRKIIIEDQRNIDPFNEPARELRVINKPLFLHQRDVLLPYCTGRELPVKSLDQLPRNILEEHVETLVHRDNLFFDRYLIDEFVRRARESGKACQVAFALDDKSIVNHALHLQKGIRHEGDYYVADLWYYPHGLEPYARPLVVDTEPYEVGYYRVPTYMAPEQGDMLYYLPMKAFLSIEHWIHVFCASILFGVFASAAHFDRRANQSIAFKLRLLLRAVIEQKQFLSSSAAVKIGRNCSIDPTAVIRGPGTVIGDNVTIGAGAHIVSSIVGNNVNIMEGCQLMLSAVGDGCYLPFRAALLTTAVMENSIIAQNTCLQKCVIGRNSFVGAGITFTDFNLIPKPVRAVFQGELQPVGTEVMGGCVGHNCRLGSGLVIYPARTVESDTVILCTGERRVIGKNISYADSDHHKIPGGTDLHPRLYDPNVRRL